MLYENNNRAPNQSEIWMERKMTEVKSQKKDDVNKHGLEKRITARPKEQIRKKYSK